MGIKKLLLLLLGFLLLCGCAPKSEPASLQIDKESSFFSDFYVEEQTVFIRCNVTVTNSGKDATTFLMYANFPDDVEIGLLTSERLCAYNDDKNRSAQFEIGADESKSFSVLFVGEYGGNYLKHDRNLPEIEIVIRQPGDVKIEETYSDYLFKLEIGVETSKADIYDLDWAKAEFEKQHFHPDVIYPISHVMTRIVDTVGACEFLIHGFYGAELLDKTNNYPLSVTMINSIEIRALNGEFYQIIDGLTTYLSSHFDDYGFAFGDWNADGGTDIRLQLFEGGTMRNEPSLFWLWDGAQAKFVENEQLGEISDTSSVYLDAENGNRLKSYMRVSASEYYLWLYEYIDGRFVLVEETHYFAETQDGVLYQVTQISKLVDGEMKVVDEIREKIEE